jgi:WD40 repeat protein
MIASAIRELSASKNPTWIAAAFFERTIQIWDVKSLKRISEFPTVFCSGARNLAFAPSAEMLVAGFSADHGKVAAYEVPNGAVLWERKLIYPSSLRFHPSGESIWCTGNRGSSLRLNVHTGATVEVIDGISQHIEGPYGDVLNVPARNVNAPFRLIAKGRNFEIEKLSFALLDARFSPDSVCLAEADGPVRCIKCTDGNQRWRFDPGADSHVLVLHYSPRIDAFFGVLRHLVDDGSRQLVRFDARSGVCKRICDLDSWEEVFLEAVDQLVTSAGEIRDLANGALVGRLAFPVRKYPDD